MSESRGLLHQIYTDVRAHLDALRRRAMEDSIGSEALEGEQAGRLDGVTRVENTASNELDVSSQALNVAEHEAYAIGGGG